MSLNHPAQRLLTLPISHLQTHSLMMRVTWPQKVKDKQITTSHISSCIIKRKLTLITDPTSDTANTPRQSSNDERCNKESEGDGTRPIECDVGKLKNDRVDLQQLTRDNKYRLLISQPNSDPSFYPRTRPYLSSTTQQFLPSWLSRHPWLHYSRFLDGAFCKVCFFFRSRSGWWSRFRATMHDFLYRKRLESNIKIVEDSSHPLFLVNFLFFDCIKIPTTPQDAQRGRVFRMVCVVAS